MTPTIRLAATGTDGGSSPSDADRVIDLDLTDESAMLCRDYAERNPEGTRALLAALNLQPTGHQADEPTRHVFDLGVYRATGCRRLASIFGSIV